MPEFEVGYFADIDHEGKGYISEAVRATLGILFNELHALRVCLDCDDTNVRSQHVAEHCGFVKEGHIRQNKRREGGILTGTFIYGLLREEFDLA
jgi:aminoglycoside 6'-N-acetyltransferase